MCDTLIGVALFLSALAFPDFYLSLVSTAGRFLNHEQLQFRIGWLLGHPAGFKPNKHLGYFIGHSILKVLSIWNGVTSKLTQIRSMIVYSIAVVGWLGASL